MMFCDTVIIENQPPYTHTLNLNKKKRTHASVHKWGVKYQWQAEQVYLPVPEGHLYHGPGFKVVDTQDRDVIAMDQHLVSTY